MKFKELKVSRLIKTLTLFGLMVIVVGCHPVSTEAKARGITREESILSNKEKSDVVSIIKYDNEKIILDTSVVELNVILKDSRKYIPLRQLSDNLGYIVDFDNKTKTIVIQENKDSKGIKLAIGSKNITLSNGKTLETDASPFILSSDNVTYVPIRIINEAFGFTVDVHGDFLTILTSTNIDNVVISAIVDKLTIDKLLKDYRLLLNDFKLIGSNVSTYIKDTEPIHKQGGFSRVNNLKNSSSEMIVDLNMYESKTIDLDTKKFISNCLIVNKSLIAFCDKTLDTMSWDLFSSNEFLSELLDLEVAYLTAESEQVKLNELLDIIIDGVKHNEDSDKN